VFPNQGFNGSNYWVDVVFTSSGPPPALTSIAVTPGTAAIVSGGTQQFTATGTYSDGSTQNITSQVTWTSSNTGVATINTAGLASGVSAGSSTLTAAQGGVTGTATLTVQAASNTGLLAPTANAAVTSGAGDNNGFETNPTRAYSLDGLFAVDANSGTGTGTSCTATGKDKHDFYSYNVNLPAGAVAKGIEVRLDAKVDSAGNAPKMCVQLSWNGGTTWTAALTTATLTTSTATYVIGGAANTWGRSWAASDFSNPNFRVRVIDVASSTSRTFSLDSIALRVTYQ
jgi:Bacterial Ig-like domain (group 2)